MHMGRGNGTVKIPDRFSVSTMQSLEGRSITRSGRIEIVNAVSMQVTRIQNDLCASIMFLVYSSMLTHHI